MTADTITLAGRRFRRVAHSTLDQDNELLRLLRIAGLRGLEAAPGEVPDDLAWRAIEQLVLTKTMFPILGCIIVPDPGLGRPAGWLRRLLARLRGRRESFGPSPWSIEVQQATAAFLGSLDDPDDKERVYQIVMDVLFPFLKAGIASWLRSPASSDPAAGTPTPSLTPTIPAEPSVHGAA